MKDSKRAVSFQSDKLQCLEMPLLDVNKHNLLTFRHFMKDHFGEETPVKILSMTFSSKQCGK